MLAWYRGSFAARFAASNAMFSTSPTARARPCFSAARTAGSSFFRAVKVSWLTPSIAAIWYSASPSDARRSTSSGATLIRSRPIAALYVDAVGFGYTRFRTRPTLSQYTRPRSSSCGPWSA